MFPRQVQVNGLSAFTSLLAQKTLPLIIFLLDFRPIKFALFFVQWEGFHTFRAIWKTKATEFTNFGVHVFDFVLILFLARALKN